MDYDFRNKGPPYDAHPSPMYRQTLATASSSPHISNFYPRVGQPAHPSIPPLPRTFSHPQNPPPPSSSSSSPSSGLGIRVMIKPEYRITPPPQLSPNVGDIPRSTFHFDFDFERKIVAEAEKRNQNWSGFGLENLPSKTAESTSSMERPGAAASRFSNPVGTSSSFEGVGSPIREEPPSYEASVMQRFESFENPMAGGAGHSFESQEEESPSSENPQFGKALYDFTAGGDDELNLTAGEEFEIAYEVDGWFYVKKKRPGRDGKMAGLVPVLYVSQS